MPSADLLVCANNDVKIYDIRDHQDTKLVYYDSTKSYEGAFSTSNPARTLLITRQYNQYSTILSFNGQTMDENRDDLTILPNYI